MYPNAGNAPAGGGSGPINTCISALGTMAGATATIFGTPMLFALTRRPIAKQLTEMWGSDLAEILTIAMGGIEGIAIFLAVKLLVAMALTWVIAVLGGRGL